jgi:hypothetical protein
MRRAVKSKFVPPPPKPEPRPVVRVHPKVFAPEDVVGEFFSVIKFNWKQWDVWLMCRDTGCKEYFLTREKQADAMGVVLHILEAKTDSLNLTPYQQEALNKAQLQ